MVLVLNVSIHKTARNHNLVALPFLISELEVLVKNTIRTRLDVHFHHSSSLAIPSLSSPQAFHSLLHHIRDESPQFLDSHLDHHEVLRRRLLLLLLLLLLLRLLLWSHDIPSQVVESRRTRRRRRRRQTAQERVDGFGRGRADS
jgi:hypothetical protein